MERAPLPLLALAAMPTDAKRGLPPEAPQPAPKRQLQRSAYDEIVADAIRTFGPVLYVCNSFEPITFTYEFWGKDRRGVLGWVTLRFTIQLNVLSRPSDPRNYLLSFRVLDRYGLVENIGEMFKNRTPPMVGIPCGGSVADVKGRIVAVVQGWLGFAERYAV
jgi:hypothetical protein